MGAGMCDREINAFFPFDTYSRRTRKGSSLTIVSSLTLARARSIRSEGRESDVPRGVYPYLAAGSRAVGDESAMNC